MRAAPVRSGAAQLFCGFFQQGEIPAEVAIPDVGVSHTVARDSYGGCENNDSE